MSILPFRCEARVGSCGFAVMVWYLAAALAGAQSASSAPAADRAQIEDQLRSLARGTGIAEVAVSPDGKRVVWTEGARGEEQILSAPIGDLKKAEHVTAATRVSQRCHESQLAWAPDSRAVAFFSDCADPGGQADLYLSKLDGDAARRLTELRGFEDAPAFAPDGSKVGFLYVPGATRPAGALAAMKPWAGVIGEEGLEVQRVAVVSVNGAAPAAPALVTPANLHVYEFDWSADAKHLAYIAADPPGENNWWVAKLYTQALDGTAHAILSPSEVRGPLHGLQIAVPRWSPDQKTIAFIGGLMSDQGVTGGDVWIVSAEGGEPQDLTRARHASPAWIEWDDDEHIFLSERAGGNIELVPVRLQADRTGGGVAASFGPPIFSVPGSVGDGGLSLELSSTADHSMFVFHANSFDHPTEIYAAKPGTVSKSGFDGLLQLSHINDGVQPGWGKSVSLTWDSDSFHVQGWLMLPKDYDPAKKYPLVVEVHGGPAAAVDAQWGARGGITAQAFSAMGYFVLQPNPRGSFGQGEEFTEANRKDFGYGDLRDILAGVNEVIGKYPVDPERVGLTGWSYGGFMTMLAVTQTRRFKAAVAGAGISDWLSYYGENSIDQWMIPYFGASVYDDPSVYARSSAINFIKQAHTPTLVVVGDRDGECPAPQSFEFWHALRDEHVPTQLVIYPNEGHGFVDPSHRRDVMARALEWFARYMPPS
jgi:dipeptidyl aminopeptidase/acylaminoacyl peptidase